MTTQAAHLWTPETAPRNGRKPGSLNRETTVLRDAALAALEKGPGGAEGFFLELRATDPVAFANFLGRLIPKTLNLDGPLAQGLASLLESAAVIKPARVIEVRDAMAGAIDSGHAQIENGHVENGAAENGHSENGHAIEPTEPTA